MTNGTKKWAWMLVLLLLASSFTMGAASSTVSAAPHTQGSSFEEGEPNIWRLSSNVAGYTRDYDNAFARTGTRSFTFSSTNTGDAASNNVNIANNLLNNLPAFEVEGGREYTVTFWYYTQDFVKHNPSFGASMALESFSEEKLAADGNGHLGGAQSYAIPEGSTAEWTEYTVRFTTHENANRLRINFGFRASSGQIWIDDVQVSAADQTPEADKTALAALIEAAAAEHEAAADSYPESAMAQLGLAISEASAVRDNSAADQAEVDAAVAALNAALQAFRETAPGDKARLAALIEEVSRQHSRAKEGDKIGEYPAGSKAILQAAIEEAAAVRELEDAGQAAIDNAEAALRAASEQFAASLLALTEGETRITIRDLSILAYYYGVDHTDPDNWSKVRMADLYDEQEITLRSLAGVARLLINDWLDED